MFLILPVFVSEENKPVYFLLFSGDLDVQASYVLQMKKKLVLFAPNFISAVCQSALAFSPRLSIFA